MRKKLFALSFLTIILIGFIFALNTHISEAKYVKTPTTQTSVNIIPERETIIPNEIVIPDLNVNLIVEKGYIENGTWSLSDYSALYAEGSASLDSKHGNTIIYAHARPGLFADLRSLRKGSHINITGEDGNLYTYKVTEGEIIRPNEVKKIMKVGDHNLTLFTCDGPEDEYRLLIRAKKI